MPRPLTPAEIESLASRVSVRRMAVENFLSSMPIDIPKWQNIANLRAEAKSYRWNEPTVRAITTGIDMAYMSVEENPSGCGCPCDACSSCVRESDDYICPQCGARMSYSAKNCPRCGVEF